MSMVNVLVLGNFTDHQSADYVMEAFDEIGKNEWAIGGVDTRGIMRDYTPLEAQKLILKEVEEFKYSPDIVVVLKGLELTLDTLQNIRDTYPNAVYINWFFDKYLDDLPIWERKNYFPVIKFFDFFFCSLKGVANRLQKEGLTNVYHLPEGCHPTAHGQTDLNHFQTQKYGSEVSFCGSVGYTIQHPKRMSLLRRIAQEEFDLRIWGDIVCPQKMIPNELRECVTGKPVVNQDHSKVVQSSLINLGIDQDTTIDQGWSARLYRVLCAGGLYLTNDTKGLADVFKVNKRDEPITADQELVVYYSEDDLVKKLDFLLEHDDIRESIARNGQKTVLESHKFVDRIRDMIFKIDTEMD